MLLQKGLILPFIISLNFIWLYETKKNVKKTPKQPKRMDLSELDATVFSGSKRPKKSYGSSFSDSGSGSFDQVFQLKGTPKPDQKSDKFGYAEIVHHTGPQDDYLAPSASSHDHKSHGKLGCANNDSRLF